MRHVRALVLDVDGVLTDGSFWWGERGEEFKRFCFADVMGISLARKAGLLVALISGEESVLVDRYAEKLNLTDYVKGCKDKATALRAFAERHHLDLGEICFMGDDINDVAAMAIAGVAAVPADAQPIAKRWASYVSKSSGGNGAVRELVESILSSQAVVRPVKSA